MPVSVRTEYTFDGSPIWHSARTASIVNQEMNSAMRESLVQGGLIAFKHTPLGATANLRGSIVTPQTESGPVTYQGKVEWGAGYARDVARGAGPRHVALSKLKLWSRVILGDEDAAEYIQRAIALNGTPSPRHHNPGTDMDLKTQAQWEPQVLLIFQKMTDFIAQRMGG